MAVRQPRPAVAARSSWVVAAAAALALLAMTLHVGAGLPHNGVVGQPSVWAAPLRVGTRTGEGMTRQAYDLNATSVGYRGIGVSAPRKWPQIPTSGSGVHWRIPGQDQSGGLGRKWATPAAQRSRTADGVTERLVPIDLRVDGLGMWTDASDSMGGTGARGHEPQWVLPRSRGWAIVCKQFDLRQLPPLHIVEFEPMLTQPWTTARNESRGHGLPPASSPSFASPSARQASAAALSDARRPRHMWRDRSGAHKPFHGTGGDAADALGGRDPADPGPNGDVVHHITVMLCPRQKTGRPMGAAFDCDEDGPDVDCEEILVIYDRGAKPFRLPENVGARIGAGGNAKDGPSPYPFAVLEVHYLPALLPSAVPPGGFLDSSGLRLWVTPDLRAHDARLFGVSDETLHLPAGRPDVEAVFTCPPATLQHQLAPTMARFGSASVFAFHLHAHGLAARLELDVVRGAKGDGQADHDSGSDAADGPSGPESLFGGWLQVLGRLSPFGGYNADQSLLYPGLRGSAMEGHGRAPHADGADTDQELWAGPQGAGLFRLAERSGAIEAVLPGPSVLAGTPLGTHGASEDALAVIPVVIGPRDTLRASCHFSTASREKAVRFGLGLLDEMCAPVVWLYPSDGTSRMPVHPDEELVRGSILRNLCLYTDEHAAAADRAKEHGQRGDDDEEFEEFEHDQPGDDHV